MVQCRIHSLPFSFIYRRVNTRHPTSSCHLESPNVLYRHASSIHILRYTTDYLHLVTCSNQGGTGFANAIANANCLLYLYLRRRQSPRCYLSTTSTNKTCKQSEWASINLARPIPGTFYNGIRFLVYKQNPACSIYIIINSCHHAYDWQFDWEQW
jgi:hypothetical protein